MLRNAKKSKSHDLTVNPLTKKTNSTCDVDSRESFRVRSTSRTAIYPTHVGIGLRRAAFASGVALVACADRVRPAVPAPTTDWLPSDRPWEASFPAFGHRELAILDLPQANLVGVEPMYLPDDHASAVTVDLQADGTLYLNGV